MLESPSDPILLLARLLMKLVLKQTISWPVGVWPGIRIVSAVWRYYPELNLLL